MKIEKSLNNLPGVIEPDCLYFIKKHNQVQCTITDNTVTPNSYDVTREISNPTLTGATEVHVNNFIEYLITNFNSFVTYTITAISGTVNTENGLIIYTAPTTVQPGGFIINGRTIDINIIPITFETPTITSHANNDIDVNVQIALASSSLLHVGTNIFPSSYTHVSTDWQLASDINFTTIVEESLNDTTNLTTWTSSLADYNTEYYIRIRYNTNVGYTQWSEVIKITTALLLTSIEPKTYVAKLIGNDSQVLDYYDNLITIDGFGNSVDIDETGNRIIVGAEKAIINYNNDSGAAFIFKRDVGNQWTQEAKLSALTPVETAKFGHSVSISGDGTRVAIGEPMLDQGYYSSVGNVHVYLRTGTTWSLEATLVSSLVPNSGYDYFGIDVDIDSTGTRIAVGSTGTDPNDVHIFKRTGTTWALEQIINPGTEVNLVEFGSSIEFNSDASRIVVGAKNKTVGTDSEAGAAYTYTRSGDVWTAEETLTSSLQSNYSHFGAVVTIDNSGNNIAIADLGSVGVSVTPTQPKIYYYTYNGSWGETAVYELQNRQSFPSSLTMNGFGNVIFAGAPLDLDSNSTKLGSVEGFRKNEFSLTNIIDSLLRVPEAVEFTKFGYALAISKDSKVLCVTQTGNDLGCCYVYIAQ